MSLHRVASIESWERRGSSPASCEHRKMSFSPVGHLVPRTATTDQLGTLEVSKTKQLGTCIIVQTLVQYLPLYVVQIFLAGVYCLLAAGVVFGYAAFKPVLVKEGVYRDLCRHDDPGDDYNTCYKQEIRS